MVKVQRFVGGGAAAGNLMRWTAWHARGIDRKRVGIREIKRSRANNAKLNLAAIRSSMLKIPGLWASSRLRVTVLHVQLDCPMESVRSKRLERWRRSGGEGSREAVTVLRTLRFTRVVWNRWINATRDSLRNFLRRRDLGTGFHSSVKSLFVIKLVQMLSCRHSWQFFRSRYQEFNSHLSKKIIAGFEREIDSLRRDPSSSNNRRN